MKHARILVCVTLAACAQIPAAPQDAIRGSFESSATHPWSVTVEVRDDRLVFDQATLVTGRTRPFDSAARRSSESEETWAEHWAFARFEVTHSESREVVGTTGLPPCGLSQVRFVVLTEGARPLSGNFEEVRLDIAYFSGEPSAATECGSDPYFTTRRVATD